MKKIGIDARLYFQTGVGVYLRNFLHFLQKETPANYQYYVYVLKKDSDQIHFPSGQFIKREVNSHWHSLSEQTKFYSILQKDNLDLMHFTYFSYPVLYKRKFIATIHDVTPLIHKTGKASTLNPLLYELKYQSFKYVLKQQVKNASIVITPTESVKNELVEIYGKQFENKIIPIYEGVNYEIQVAKENVSLQSEFQKPFFLYVGNFYPHKNVEMLISAFKQIKTDVELVLVGPHNYFSSRIQKEIADKQITNIRIVHTGSNNDLVFFYKHAIALINPSISEGFGLPLVEAAYFNLPIIASDLPVFHEIFGSNFLSFDPSNPDELQGILGNIIQKKQKLIKPVLVKTLSFEHLTKEIIRLYNQVI